jgi:hypothetical protein
VTSIDFTRNERYTLSVAQIAIIHSIVKMAEVQAETHIESNVEEVLAPQVEAEIEVEQTNAQAPESEANLSSFQAQQDRMKALHKHSAEGDVMGVRGILSGSLELLESIGECTRFVDFVSKCVFRTRGTRKQKSAMLGR